MNVIFSPPVTVHYIAFFFLFVWVYLKNNLFCNDCLQFKSINPKFFQETDSEAGFTCKNRGAGFRQPLKRRDFNPFDPWGAHVCSGIPPSFLTDVTGQPCKHVGAEINVSKHLTYPGGFCFCLLWSPLPILSPSVCSCELLSDQCSLNLGPAFVSPVSLSPFPLKESLYVFWVRLERGVEVVEISKISGLAC